MRNPNTRLFLLGAGASILLTGCGGAATSSSASSSINQPSSSSSAISSLGKEEIIDMAGRKVTVDLDSVKKVLCIGAGALRLYSYINGTELLCAVEDIDNPSKNSELNKQFASSPRPYYMVYGDSLKSLPSCGKGGPSNQAAEKELIAAADPDLVISEYEDVSAADELQNAIGAPVLTLKYDTKNIFGEALYSSLRMIGKVTNKASRSEELVSYIEGAVTDLGNRTKDIQESDKDSIYLGCLGNWGVQDIYMTCKDYPLFKIDNIKNAVDDVLSVTGFQNIDKEAFFTLNPDKIILDASGLSKFKTTYKGTLKSSFDSLDAFTNGELYLQMPYNNYYTNIETALMDAYYDGSVSFPPAFSDVDIAKKSDEISKKFLGKELYADMCALPNSYGGFGKISLPSLTD